MKVLRVKRSCFIRWFKQCLNSQLLNDVPCINLYKPELLVIWKLIAVFVLGTKGCRVV